MNETEEDLKQCAFMLNLIVIAFIAFCVQYIIFGIILK